MSPATSPGWYAEGQTDAVLLCPRHFSFTIKWILLVRGDTMGSHRGQIVSFMSLDTGAGQGTWAGRQIRIQDVHNPGRLGGPVGQVFDFGLGADLTAPEFKPHIGLCADS